MPTLFVPRYDTHARSAYSEWVNHVPVVRERELRQRAALTNESERSANSSATVGGCETVSQQPLAPPTLRTASSTTTFASPACTRTPQLSSEAEVEGAAFIATLQASTELRDHALQRRDAALLALSHLSLIPSLGQRLAQCEGLVVRLALIVETTVGYTDAPSIAASVLARIATAPEASAAVSAVLIKGNLLSRLRNAASFSPAIQTDVESIFQMVKKQLQETS